MEDRARRLLLVGTPLAAAATVALALRAGAPSATRGASMYIAPISWAAKSAAWQIVTYVDDRGVKESVPMKDLRVVARAGDRFAEWRGESNRDGVAEALLAFSPHAGEDVAIEVTEGEATLAKGSFTFRPPAWIGNEDAAAWVRPTKREGALRLDVAVQGGRLPVGFWGKVWVRTVDAAADRPVESAALTVLPEAGLEVKAETPKPSCKNGWTEVDVNPMGHVVGMTVRARAPSGATGEWFGGLPVAGGADSVDLPLVVPANAPWSVHLLSPGARGVAYAEIADAKGRAWAAAITLPRGGEFAGADLTLPPLSPGLKWLVTAGDPRGAERLTGAAVARPFLVAEHPEAQDRCALAETVAVRIPAGFPRSLALDGVDRHPERRKRAWGLAVAVASVALAALLEAILLVQGARQARDTLRRALESEGEAGADVAGKPAAGGVVVGVLVALLGFGLLAALLLWKG
jgi:hypothetical protein